MSSFHLNIDYKELHSFLQDLLEAKTKSENIPSLDKEILGKAIIYLEPAIGTLQSTFSTSREGVSTAEFYILLLWTLGTCIDSMNIFENIIGLDFKDQDIVDNMPSIKEAIQKTSDTLEEHIGKGIKWWIKNNIKIKVNIKES